MKGTRVTKRIAHILFLPLFSLCAVLLMGCSFSQMSKPIQTAGGVREETLVQDDESTAAAEENTRPENLVEISPKKGNILGAFCFALCL